MKDSDLSLHERIEAAITRITNGQGQMRMPAEATDPDLVLADCESAISELVDVLREYMNNVPATRLGDKAEHILARYSHD